MHHPSRLLSIALLAALLRRNALALPGLRDLSNEWIGRQPTAAHDRAVSDTCSGNKPVTQKQTGHKIDPKAEPN